MIWEVDEESDNAISWDEFQLTYYRNIVSISSFPSVLQSVRMSICPYVRVSNGKTSCAYLVIDGHNRDRAMHFLPCSRGSLSLHIDMSLLVSVCVSVCMNVVFAYLVILLFVYAYTYTVLNLRRE